MSKISVLGIDLAKNVFQLHGVDQRGNVVLRKQVKRRELLVYLANLPTCLIGIEACSGMHYWSREFTKLGHTVRAMAPAFVKPYLKSNKNDANDAEAICEAVQRPSMRFCTVKTKEQQAILQLHRSRELLVGQRVGLSNHLRALLGEFGLTIPKGESQFINLLPGYLEDAENELPMPVRQNLSQLYEHYHALKAQIQQLESAIKIWHNNSEVSQRVSTIPGIGVLTATALVGSIGDGSAFRNGRQLAAYLGLVPGQASSGGKDKLLGISKRGDGYLRKLLVHGARSVARSAKRRDAAGLDNPFGWLTNVIKRTHVNRACVAQANKTARIVWCVLTRSETYRAPTHALAA